MGLGRILRTRNAPKGFLGMLVLVLLIEGTVRLNRTTFTGYNGLSWAFTRAQVETQAVGADVLCLGDSRVKYAVLPRVIEASTGCKAFNLAITAGRPASSYVLLRSALAAGAKPRAVVVDFDEKFLAAEPLSLDLSPPWSDLLTPQEAAELERTVGAPDFAAKVALEQVLHTLKSRHEIRTMVSKLVRFKGFRSRRFHEVALRNWAVNQGAQVNSKRVYNAPPPPPPGRKEEGTWEPNALNVQYIERFLTLAGERGIPVYWLLPPRCPTVQQWREEYGEERRYEQFVAKTLDRFPNVTVVDARHSGYQTDVFVDIVHLDRDGAATLSHDLAVALDILPTLQPKPRWAQLPEYRDVPPKVALEDFEDSRQALKFGAQSGNQADLIRRVTVPTPRLIDQPDDRLGELSRVLR